MNRHFCRYPLAHRVALFRCAAPLFLLGLTASAKATTPPLAVNMGPFTGNNAHVAHVVQETLLTDLAKSDQLTILDERAHSAPSAGPAAFVLTGACLTHGNRIAINMRLLDGATRRTIPGATENIDGPRDQLFSMTHALADRLRIRLVKLSAAAPPVKAPSTAATSGPDKRPSAGAADESKTDKPYTSVIVDTRGFKVERSPSPCLRRMDGSAVWSGEHATPEFVIEAGIVVYERTEEDARANARAGDNPLILKAAGRYDDNFRCDLLLSEEDVDLLLKSTRRFDFLAKFKVIFIVD